MSFEIHLIPVLNDNYSYAVCAGDKTAIVDPGESGPVQEWLTDHNRRADMILITHHHGDHVGGVAALKAQYDAHVVGPAAEADKIDTIDQTVTDGETVDIFGHSARIIATPGHTLGHICYYIADDAVLFSGDTLFVMGCGRVFEGTMEQMHQSLQTLAALPDETHIYCGHEYTKANVEFLLKVEPDHSALREREREVLRLRQASKPTIPTTIAQEKQTNLFLTAESAAAFAALRKAKDAA